MKAIDKMQRDCDNFMREVIIFWAAIFVFPFKTVRILAWKWERWIQNSEAIIKERHRVINDSVYGKVKNLKK
ncbi:hypothetical protein Phi4:1_gp182 [Cellulophaga phage phi4:1]|uniref:Uncharacterized protein n=3 Tax=Lightbulbvirus Cba41 TaxID=1918524 RepID=A0A0S2MWT1_9CAUD|nr:hypothetical protein Phi4:1_gp182 [Cellulophaga phage phi4:1]AGO49595.1 hypothetical protein Phi4:1_gp182 [Cellulophaga phage phi4:1]ALO80191.1 hypothetical protein Phi4113_182 [Cellulophaga phage phi4:1_13]ALO80388.1 hypothetical protein Phi4118_182 [Cellulophaga phage phi4:1_18]